MTVRKLAVPATILLALAGCSRTGDIEATGGVGITAVRSACPQVGVPAGTGDITLFSPEDSTDASAIDVVAVITNVKAACDDSVDPIVSSVSFEVQGRRTRTDGARSVTLPYFITVVQGGSQVVAKRVGQVTLNFEPGAARATAAGTANASVTREASTLPPEVMEQITRRRKAGDQEAAVDPLTNPQVRQAVLRSTFEALVGFQLTDAQLRYNVTR